MSDTRAGQKREITPRDDSTDQPAAGRSGILATGLALLVTSVALFVIGPLIQRQAVDAPPAWTLVAIVLLGALFGVMGIALAVPPVAIGRVAIIRFYVEDYLGDDRKPTTADKS